MPNDRQPSTTISGYVAKSEMRYTANGLAVLSFSIPIKVWSKKEREGYKKAYSGNGYECTAWYNVVCFGDVAEAAAQWLDKGSFVECDVKPNGDIANGYMNPKQYNGRTSYDWIANAVSPVDNEEKIQEEPPDFIEECEIPF